jgi:hypothetical protein
MRRDMIRRFVALGAIFILGTIGLAILTVLNKP